MVRGTPTAYSRSSRATSQNNGMTKRVSPMASTYCQNARFSRFVVMTFFASLEARQARGLVRPFGTKNGWNGPENDSKLKARFTHMPGINRVERHAAAVTYIVSSAHLP